MPRTSRRTILKIKQLPLQIVEKPQSQVTLENLLQSKLTPTTLTIPAKSQDAIDMTEQLLLFSDILGS